MESLLYFRRLALFWGVVVCVIGIAGNTGSEGTWSTVYKAWAGIGAGVIVWMWVAMHQRAVPGKVETVLKVALFCACVAAWFVFGHLNNTNSAEQGGVSALISIVSLVMQFASLGLAAFTAWETYQVVTRAVKAARKLDFSQK
jgi:drug/metabolite transporter (DMT)-like permease